MYLFGFLVKMNIETDVDSVSKSSNVSCITIEGKSHESLLNYEMEILE